MRRTVAAFQVAAVAGAAAMAMIVGSTLGPTSAQAQNYPWCAHYGTPYDDTSCGFVSFEQCMASVSGIGGFCQKNDTYKPPLAVRPQGYRHHAKSS